MKIVRGYTVASPLLVQGHTDLVAKVGDIVNIYLDQVADPAFPVYIRATIQNPIITDECGAKTAYSFSYDESLLNGAITRLRNEDIVDVLVFSTVGRSAYESYLLTTEDSPVLTEAQWGAQVRVVTSTTPPTDTSVIWLDPETGIYSIYSGGGWVTQLQSTGIPNGAITLAGNLLTFQGNQLTFTS